MWKNFKILASFLVLVQVINFQATKELKKVLQNPDGTVLLFLPKGPYGKPVYSPELKDLRPKVCIFKDCLKPSLSSLRMPQVQGKKINSKGLPPVAPLPLEPLPEGVVPNRYGIYPFCQEHSQTQQEKLNQWLAAHVKGEIFHFELIDLKDSHKKLDGLLCKVKSKAGNLEGLFTEEKEAEQCNQLWAKALEIQGPLSDSLELTKKAARALQYLKILALYKEEKEALVRAVNEYKEVIKKAIEKISGIFTEEELEVFDKEETEGTNQFDGLKNTLIGLSIDATMALKEIVGQIRSLLPPAPKPVKAPRKTKSVVMGKDLSPRRPALDQSVSRATGTLGSSTSISSPANKSWKGPFIDSLLK